MVAAQWPDWTRKVMGFDAHQLSNEVTSYEILSGVSLEAIKCNHICMAAIAVTIMAWNDRRLPDWAEEVRSTSPALQWHDNVRDGISNHRRLDWLFNRLFRRRWKKTPKLSVTGLCGGIHRWPVDSLHKGTATRRMFPFDDVIVEYHHDDIRTWIRFPLYWLFAGEYAGVLWIPSQRASNAKLGAVLLLTRTNFLRNSCVAADLRRHEAMRRHCNDWNDVYVSPNSG